MMEGAGDCALVFSEDERRRFRLAFRFRRRGEVLAP
jgi:hypothetical protein